MFHTKPIVSVCNIKHTLKTFGYLKKRSFFSPVLTKKIPFSIHSRKIYNLFSLKISQCKPSTHHDADIMMININVFI